ncbi:MAG: peptidylprolyl isomerase, partial [Lachnospiraceae bacterium]
LLVKMQRLAAISNVADKRGIVLTRDAKNNVSKAATEYLNKISSEYADEYSITQEQLEHLFSLFAIAKQLYGDITDDLKIEISADSARVISIQYIVTDSEESAKEAVSRLAAGESFAVMIKDYGGSVDGSTTVKRGQMQEEFENAAFELKSGEISNIVNASGRYYIIKCVSDNEKTLSETNKTALINEKKLEEFNKVLNEYEAGAFVEIAERKWEKITLEKVPDLGVSFNEIFSKYF